MENPIRIAVYGHAPWVNNYQLTGNYPGIAAEVSRIMMGLLSKSFNITPNYVISNAYGALMNKKWTGIIGDIHRGDADISIPLLTPYPERAAAVNFVSPPVFQLPQCFLLNPLESNHSVNIFSSFGFAFWVVLVAAYFATSATIAIIMKTQKPEGLVNLQMEWCFNLLFSQRKMTLGRNRVFILVTIWSLCISRFITTMVVKTNFFKQFRSKYELPDSYDMLSWHASEYRLVLATEDSYTHMILNSPLSIMVKLRKALLRYNHLMLIKNDFALYQYISDNEGTLTVSDCIRFNHKTKYLSNNNLRIITLTDGSTTDNTFAISKNASTILSNYLHTTTLWLNQVGIIDAVLRRHVPPNTTLEIAMTASLTINDYKASFLIILSLLVVPFIALVYETIQFRKV